MNDGPVIRPAPGRHAPAKDALTEAYGLALDCAEALRRAYRTDHPLIRSATRLRQEIAVYMLDRGEDTPEFK